MISRSFFLAAIACAIMAGVGCLRQEQHIDRKFLDQILVLGNGAEPADLDPQIITTYTDQRIMIALFEGLTAIDEVTSQPVPAAAEEWGVSSDGLTWTFHLRENLKWSNGNPLTADDFIQSWRRMLSPALGAEYAYLFFAVKNAEAFNRGEITDPTALGFSATDAQTLVIHLTHPIPYLPTLVAQPAWFPVNPRVLESFGALTQRGTRWTQPGNHVGNGPFMLKEWIPHSRITVARNPYYWNAGQGRIRGVEFYPIENPAVEERYFRSGNFHITSSVPLTKIPKYREESSPRLRHDPFLQTSFLRFNVTKPPFNDRRLRRAFALAITREAIARNVLNGSRPPASSLTPPGTGGYTARAKVSTNFDEARRLLVEAGHPGGKGFPPIELLVRNDEIQPSVAEVLQAVWQNELGVRVTITTVEQKTWIQNQQTLNYTLCSASWAGDFLDPLTFLDLFLTSGGNNWTGWGNPEYDRLLTEAARTINLARRHELYQQAESLLLEEAPIVPLYFGAQNYLIKPSVKNWRPALLGFHRYQFIELTK